MCHFFFIYSSVDEHLGCFHVLAIVNTAAMNNRIHMSLPFQNSLPLPSPSYPSRLIQSPCLSFLSQTANSRWLSILHMVMKVSMLLCPYISLAPPLSPCPQVYSLCLFLHCCPANKLFSTIFLDSIYMH